MRAIKTTATSILALGLLAGSAVGVAAQSAVVTGSVAGGDDCEMTPEGAEFCSGGRFEFDDPRLTGDYESTQTLADAFEGGEGFEMGFIATEEFRVTNDEGAWSGQYHYADFFPSEVPEGYRADTLPEEYQHVESGNNSVLFGEGAYEGLTAYLTDGPVGTWGIIVDPQSME